MLDVMLMALLANDVTVQPADQVGAALKYLEPAGSSCKRQDESPQASTTSTRDYAPDLSCAVSAHEVSKRMSAGALHLVDTRTESEYLQGHIDGAINLSWGEVRVRNHLRSRPIVLLGSGKSDESLYIACAALKAAGVPKVSVLRGGMLVWRDAGMPLIGASEPLEEMRRLSDEQFMQALAVPSNIIVAMPEADDFTALTPRVIRLRSASDSAISDLLTERARQIGDIPFAGIVVLVSRGSRADSLAAAIRAVHPHPILTYAGTAKEYSAYVKTKRAMWVAQARGPKPLPCSTR